MARFGSVASRARAGARLILHLSLIVICLAWLAPTLGLLVSSFRPKSLISTSGWWEAFTPPFKFTLENYAKVLGQQNIGRSFLNSLIIAVPATVLPISIAAFAAYAFAWMRFKSKELLYSAVIVMLVVPIQVTLIPVLRIFTGLGINGSFAGIWLAHTAFGLPFSIFLLRNSFEQIPPSMLESAFMDGASHPVVFLRLVLPTTIPGIASLAIFQFMWVWNDLLVAMVFLGGTADVAPLTVRIANLVNSYGQGWQILTSAAFISMLLPLVVFFSLQKYYIRGITAGSVKE